MTSEVISCKIRSSKIAHRIQLCNYLESKQYFWFLVGHLFENLKKTETRKEKVSPVGPFLSVAAFDGTSKRISLH